VIFDGYVSLPEGNWMMIWEYLVWGILWGISMGISMGIKNWESYGNIYDWE
jgi:hypothetical protein